MAQGYFINSWLLPCSLRSHRTANPTPNNGKAIIRLCPPTTQIQALQRDNNNERLKTVHLQKKIAKTQTNE